LKAILCVVQDILLRRRSDQGLSGFPDTIVALEMREPAPPVMYDSESPAADLASINAAIAKERADRGQEAEPARNDSAQVSNLVVGK
jgi:hypothetical protein